MKNIKSWEIWGAVISIVIGSLLHFVFDWSGGSKVVALFGAVNESTWEHLKLAFWPTLIYTTIEWFAWGRGQKNFCFASLIKLFSMPLIIVGLFYGWLAIFPDNFIWDISIFIVAVIAGYMLSYKILQSKKSYGYETVALILIILGIAKFSFMTYAPIKSFLTHDPISGGYGIVDKSQGEI
jgi:hypothetical protein